MKVNSRHQQHPQVQPKHRNRKLAANTKCRLARAAALRHLCLDIGALERAIAHDDTALVGNPSRPAHHRPKNLVHQHRGSQHKQKHVARDVMPAAPLSTGSLARDSRKRLLGAGLARDDAQLGQVALAARPPESAINHGRAKAPLRDEDPPDSDACPAQQSLHLEARRRGREAGVRERKGKQRERVPAPAALDKDDVEQVRLARKVARLGARLVRVRLRHGVVGRRARGGRDEGEDGAEDEEHGEEA